MIGQGVVLECLEDDAVTEVWVVGRRPCGVKHEKLREHVLLDPSALGSLEGDLRGLGACFYCLGVSSSGMKEADYRRVTLDLALRIAEALVRTSPELTFVHVSGAGTDETGKSRMMWARVKGEAENATARLPFARVFQFRPSFIQPEKGVSVAHSPYGWIYRAAGPLGAILLRHAPGYATSTSRVGRAMLEVARHGFEKPILESVDINVAASRSTNASPRAATGGLEAMPFTCRVRPRGKPDCTHP